MKKFYKVFIVVILMVLILGISGLGMKVVNAKDTNSTSKTAVATTKSEEVADSENEVTSEETSSNNKGIGMIAAALATGLACLGAGIAVALVASSAVGAISENPSLLGKTIIFAGLAEGIAIYGLIISIMILNKI